MEDKKTLLLERIEKLKEQSNIYIYHDNFLNMDLEIKKLSVTRYSELVPKNNDFTDNIKAMCKLIYNFVPLFQDKEIIEKTGKMKNESVIELIYDSNLKAMTKVVEFINSLYGNDTNEDEEIKKQD